jgi:hypothetical protein
MILIEKLSDYIIRKILVKGWYGKVTLHIEDGKIVRVNEDRSIAVI